MKRSRPVRVGCQVAVVYAVTKGYLNEVPTERVAQWEEGFFTYLSDRYGDLMKRIENGIKQGPFLKIHKRKCT